MYDPLSSMAAETNIKFASLRCYNEICQRRITDSFCPFTVKCSLPRQIDQHDFVGIFFSDFSTADRPLCGLSVLLIAKRVAYSVCFVYRPSSLGPVHHMLLLRACLYGTRIFANTSFRPHGR